MEHMQELVNKSYGTFQGKRINGLLVSWLDKLKVPGTEFVSEQFVNYHERI